MKRLSFIFLVCLFLPNIALAGEYTSTEQDQKQIAVTIYNNNLGLVKDLRQIKINSGEHYLKFMDVASQIQPVTVNIKSLTSPDKLSVLEQNYEYDLLNPQKLLDKFVGKQVKLIDKNYYTGKEEIMTAELLSNNGSPIYKINNEIQINPPGRVILPEIPENLIAKPTLIWMLKNSNPKAQDIEASYLTNGINWKSDYIAVINADNSIADLSGWVTINNQSGAAYKNALIKLVAGDVNRVQENKGYKGRAATERLMEKDAAGDFQEESFFEYHLYTLQRPSTIKNQQTKQIELLKAVDIPLKEKLVYYGANYYYRSQNTGQVLSNEKIGVFLEIENKEKNNLGMPLPAGIIRAYKKDKQGSLQFIGEDKIDHTPKDEKIIIKMGDAFDVVGERKQLDYKILSRNSNQRFDTEQQWQIKLRNHKDKEVEIEVIEPIPGDWQIIDSSEKYIKTEASTIKFVVKLKKDEEKIIDYRVKIRYW
ncbi:MAG: DUF4139 domain-containing protein [Candidatus Omnitrophica bacterium]|nr:DUF4139 domain-containing protein [Candidatus Omnitrophota bacterium]